LSLRFGFRSAIESDGGRQDSDDTQPSAMEASRREANGGGCGHRRAGPCGVDRTVRKLRARIARYRAQLDIFWSANKEMMRHEKKIRIQTVPR
jgi:hypothetical protein